MSQIEPELTTEGVKMLNATYASETPEQTHMRARRYDDARAEYMRRYNAYIVSAHKAADSYKKEIRDDAEGHVRDAEAPLLERIFQSILNLLPLSR